MSRNLLLGTIPLLLIGAADLLVFGVLGAQVPPPPDSYPMIASLVVFAGVAAIALIPRVAARAISGALLAASCAVSGIGLYYLPAAAAAVTLAIYQYEHRG
jgi:hypothetical protein